jgi:post-segregation antitoxin (ccd killing protein)
MPIVRRGGTVYAQTSVQIPEKIRNEAREAGIGLSATLTDALVEKLQKNRAGRWQ